MFHDCRSSDTGGCSNSPIPVKARSGEFDGGVEFLLEQLAGWQGGEVVGNVDAG